MVLNTKAKVNKINTPLSCQKPAPLLISLKALKCHTGAENQDVRKKCCHGVFTNF